MHDLHVAISTFMHMLCNAHLDRNLAMNFVITMQSCSHAAMPLPSLCHLMAAAHCTQQSCQDWTLSAASKSWDHCHPSWIQGVHIVGACCTVWLTQVPLYTRWGRGEQELGNMVCYRGKRDRGCHTGLEREEEGPGVGTVHNAP